MVKRIRFMTCLFYHNKEKWKEKKKRILNLHLKSVGKAPIIHQQCQGTEGVSIGKGHLDFSSFRNKQNETK